MTLPWFKFSPQDFLDGVVGLTPEERGCYITILALMYRRQGPIPDQARWLAGNCMLSVRRWRTVRAALIVKAKLFEVNLNGEPCLMNERAARELGNAKSELSADYPAEKSAKSQDKPAEKAPESSKNNGLQAVDIDIDIDIEREEELPPNGGSPPKSSDPVREAFEAWNDLASRLKLPRAKLLDKARRTAIQARLRDGGLPEWRRALVAVERSPLCRGENERAWRADLDFVCQAKSWRRLLEGFYGDDGPAAGTQTLTPDEQAARHRMMVEFYEQQGAGNA